MTKSKDKEDTFITKLDKLEEAGKERERPGLKRCSFMRETEDELPLRASRSSDGEGNH
ncbi:MAG: hypothetical protein U0103_21855 [Candidatus Obscuribacterales bacterium]